MVDEWAGIERERARAQEALAQAEAERAAARERWWAEVEAAEGEALLEEGSRWRTEEEEARRGGRARGRPPMRGSFSGWQVALHGGQDEVDAPVAVLGRAEAGTARRFGIGFSGGLDGGPRGDPASNV